jgi:hypothetical protein
VSFPRSGAVALACIVMSSACLAATGCGGNSDPLSGMSGTQVVSKAVSDLKAEPHFSISGKVNSSGQDLSLTLGYKPPTGCTGTIGLDTKGSFGVVSIGDTVWVKPDNTFWRSFAGSSAPQVIALLGGKYLKTTSSDSNMADLVKLCNVSELSSTFTGAGTVTKGDVTTVDGQSALTLKDSKGGTLYVTDTASPRILQVSNPSKSDGGSLTFTYGAVTVTAPPASQTVDGAKYGM